LILLIGDVVEGYFHLVDDVTIYFHILINATIFSSFLFQQVN